MYVGVGATQALAKSISKQQEVSNCLFLYGVMSRIFVTNQDLYFSRGSSDLILSCVIEQVDHTIQVNRRDVSRDPFNTVYLEVHGIAGNVN